jgi:hypothetical protein
VGSLHPGQKVVVSSLLMHDKQPQRHVNTSRLPQKGQPGYRDWSSGMSASKIGSRGFRWARKY